MLITLSEEIKDLLNAESLAANFSKTFIAERVYVPQVKLEDSEDLKIFVRPDSEDNTPMDRSSEENDYNIEVGIIQRVEDVNALAEVDNLILFVYEIKAFLRGDNVSDDQYKYISTSVIPLDYKDFDRSGLFVSVLTLTYKDRTDNHDS